jgi:hypothetical protein
MKPIPWKRFLLITICLLLTLMSFARPAGAAESLIQEVWNLVEQNGQPVGYGCDKLWRNSNGFRLSSDGVMQMQYGGQVTKMIIHLEMLVDKRYLARSYTTVINTNGSIMNISGTFDSKQALITTTTPDGREYQKTYPLEQPVYFENSFLQYLADKKKLKAGTSYHGPAWDAVSGQLEDYAVTVEKAENYDYAGKKIPVFRVTETKAQGNQFLIDIKGINYWGKTANQLEFRRIEKDQIPELKSATVDLLVIPGNIKLDHPLRSMTSRISITWNNIPLSEFKLEDNRQKLLDSKKTSTVMEATLEIQKDTRDHTGKITLPVNDETLAPYLADSEYITATLPEIQKAAKELLGNEPGGSNTADGWAATRKLVDWVYHYLTPDNTIETLTTAQILKNKKGKCTEYAILFAAMARSAGLPTRLVIGQRYINHNWISHMWDEVWLGQWVAVDASFNQTAPDAMLIKLTDGDSVAAVKKLRFKLSGNLGINIQDATIPTPETSDHQLVTPGIDGQVYSNIDFNCQISAPEGWTLAEREEEGMPILWMTAPSKQTNALLIMFSVPQGTKAQEILDIRIPGLQQSLPKFLLTGQETLDIGSTPAAVGTWTFEHQSGLYRQQNWIIIRGDSGYLFVFESSDSQWADFQKEFKAIRESFRTL